AMPGLPALLWQRMPFVVAIGTLLLTLLGWRLFLYTGPKLNLAGQTRRNLLEHIDATAEFAWRVDRGQRLFEENRNVIEHAWRRRHPVLNALTVNKRCEWIGDKTGLTASAIERTLYGDVAKEQDFIKATAVLQRLTVGLRQKRDLP
ncbi:MAG: hypothetical protein MI754_03555, partial [Chromatiales bacterium]|nr:hypothetical protein [Chromatiales bacterium]